jgi:RNA 2',3'-cyclic 3'-phosphodiesterase
MFLIDAVRRRSDGSAMRANWFFGFPMNGAFVLDLPEPPSGFRRFHPDDVHLTLAFLGGCGEPAARAALTALDEQLRISARSALDVSLAEVVPMGAPHRYTALSALLGRGREDAITLLSELRDVLTDAAGGPRETRPAKPHVTLARPRNRASNADRQAGVAWAARLDLRAVHARLDRIALYTWSELRRERLFQIVAERQLP